MSHNVPIMPQSDETWSIAEDVTQQYLVRLPSEQYKLHVWKVRPGTAVRQGEVIALAMEKNESGSHDNNSQDRSPPVSGNSTVHKRPAKRRRMAATAQSGVSDTTINADSTKTPSDDSVTSAGRLQNESELNNQAASTNSNHELVSLVASRDGILRVGLPPGGFDEDDKDVRLVKGYIELCSHPTVLGGLCAVCGKTINAEQHSKLEENNQQGLGFERGTDSTSMSQMTVSGGVTVSVSEKEGQLIAQQDAGRLHKLRKLSLVLDLDHTLVHATNDIRARAQLHHADVRSLLLPAPPFIEGGIQQERRIQHFVKLRPHVKEFLSKLQDCYEIGVYTAGTREYANEITILLARYLVGATYDQFDLEQLWHKIFVMEAELTKSKSSLFDQGSSSEQDDESSKRLPLDVGAEQTEVAYANETHALAPDDTSETGKSAVVQVEAINADGGDEETGKHFGEEQRTNPINSDSPGDTQPVRKRKRVAFGEPPVTHKTDQVTDHDLDKLKQELAEAERLEALAVEMRKRVFGSRVVSRSDVGDLGTDVKSLKRIFPCGGSMAAVVDDREDVWANAQDGASSRRPGEPPDNLLVVRPYHWDTFLGFADVNNASGVDLSVGPDSQAAKTPVVNSETDQQLLWTIDVLLRLHRRYYDRIDQAVDGSRRPTVPEILATMRREVLQGCNVVFSGLIPLHKQNSSADHNQPRPAIVRYVENLGGCVLSNVSQEVTHVIGAKDGTDKIVAARKVPGCVVVKLLWLMECVWSVTRRNELDHLLGRPTGTSSSNVKRPLIESTRDNSSSSSDEDDDLLAAELENEFL